MGKTSASPMIGLLGKKLGMTHVYDAFGRRNAVTAVQAGPCTILQLREPARHGYGALQLGFEPVEESALTKPERGQFKRAGTGGFRYVREFRLPAPPADASPPRGTSAGEGGQRLQPEGDWQLGRQLTVELFTPYELVDVTGLSIGKGFQGGVKRWHWKGGPATHGSMSHRAPGSIGSTTTPGRVWRGHHLPGRMGADRVTVQNVRVLGVDPAHHLLLIEGAIPGAERGLVMVRKSRKHPGRIKKPQAFQVIVEEEDEAAKKPAKTKK